MQTYPVSQISAIKNCHEEGNRSYTLWLESPLALHPYLTFLPVLFQKQLIGEVKMVTRVLFLFIPLPMFWALFDQQVQYSVYSSAGHLCPFRVTPQASWGHSRPHSYQVSRAFHHHCWSALQSPARCLAQEKERGECALPNDRCYKEEKE